MRKAILIEVLGWILTGFGAYFVFEDNTSILHYILLAVGIILILFSIPFSLRRWKK
ncbi:hypothetical protein ACFQ3N_01205 [Virgibacillus byunsanensis]|uniref:Uncharacterized protein n=1 Tax=Virgibacillus byunsanensis TaxID=570945 RepID=A0ABW3LIK9_9BACI